MSLRVARALKRRHPDCLIVFGGPQVPDPDRADGFFSRFPFIDVAVHGEGEVTFTELLAAHARGEDLVAVPGLSCRSGTAPARGRTTDLDAFPSPYLTGVFEPLFALPFSYHAVWETNRGCPYRCAFCDWGSLTNQKLYTFRDDRLSAEIEYFAARKIGYVYMADANFGILPRDLDIARRLANTKARTGLPHKLRVNYAKNSPDRVHEIARTLNAVQLDKGITLSVQSMDAHTLQTITRTNLKYESLSRFIRQYQREGIDTITEVILGLPGETLRSFRDGIDELLEASAHDTLWIYRCTVLPNAQMNDPPYRARHGIVTKRTPVFLNHTVPGSDPVQEYEDIVTETATLSREDYKRCLILSWAVQTFHALNLTQVIAICSRVLGGLKFTDFYDELLRFTAERPHSVVGRELRRTSDLIDGVIEREGTWDNVVPEFSPLTWALEEASYLRIVLDLDRFYAELEEFMTDLEARGRLRLEPGLRDDVLAYQKAIVVKWAGRGSTTLLLGHSIHSFYRGVLTGEPVELKRGAFRVTIVDPYDYAGDRQRYATEVVFWGRRGGKIIYQAVEERELIERLQSSA
jgi:radical SAM superfamily enzyme YgiQ (UPF0313 family)